MTSDDESLLWILIWEVRELRKEVQDLQMLVELNDMSHDDDDGESWKR